jgi:hypothetical protein
VILLILFSSLKSHSCFHAKVLSAILSEITTPGSLNSVEPLKLTAKTPFVKKRKERRKDKRNKIIFKIFI